MKRIIGITAFTLGILQSATAYSNVTGTLVYTEPTGTVNANETIDVWVRLTLDLSSDSLTYDPFDPYPNGVNPADIPIEGYSYDQNAVVPFDLYDYIFQSVGRVCDDTFAVGCSDPGSQYGYTADFGADSWFNFSGTIFPGESRDFKLYELTPTGGAAAPGTYSLFTTDITLNVEGTDEFGGTMDAAIYEFSTDCPDANCTFTRTVSNVPVPAAVWLFGSGLLGLIGVARRKARV